MRPAALVRRHDAHPLWTRIALCGLLGGLLLAVLGMPHLDIHGPLHYLGVMDPFCGGTRSVYRTLRGHLRDAVRYNPAGPMLVLAAVALALRAAIGWSSRRWLDVHMPARLLIPVAVVTLVALDVNQQLHGRCCCSRGAGRDRRAATVVVHRRRAARPAPRSAGTWGRHHAESGQPALGWPRCRRRKSGWVG